MEKIRLTRILSRANGAQVEALAQAIKDVYPAAILRGPVKTLVMMPLAEPVRGTPFYLGELFVAETMVELAGAKGFGICMGGDLERSVALAILDAAYNAGVPECAGLTETLEAWERAQEWELAREAAAHRRSMVSFGMLEGQ